MGKRKHVKTCENCVKSPTETSWNHRWVVRLQSKASSTPRRVISSFLAGSPWFLCFFSLNHWGDDSNNWMPFTWIIDLEVELVKCSLDLIQSLNYTELLNSGRSPQCCQSIPSLALSHDTSKMRNPQQIRKMVIQPFSLLAAKYWKHMIVNMMMARHDRSWQIYVWILSYAVPGS